LEEIENIKKDNKLRKELDCLKEVFKSRHRLNHSCKKDKDYLRSKQHAKIEQLISQNREQQLETIGKLQDIHNYFAQLRSNK